MCGCGMSVDENIPVVSREGYTSAGAEGYTSGGDQTRPYWNAAPAPVLYECWSCGEGVPRETSSSSLYYCLVCQVEGSIDSSAVFMNSTRTSYAYFCRASDGVCISEPFLDHGTEHVPSPA